MKVLITGFEAFGEIKTNSTELVLNKLLKSKKIDTLLLPVENNKCFSILKKKIEETTYDYIILLGQAANRDKVSIERVALNFYDFPIKDNSGKLIVDKKIIEGEENALLSTLPIRNIFLDLIKNGINSEISNSAGTYICNEIFFKTLNYTKNTKIKVGFIHLPLVLEQNCINFTTKWTLFQLCLSVEKIVESCSKYLK